MVSSVLASLFGQATLEELDAKVTLDSQILTEQFYFYTVVIMWLIQWASWRTRPAWHDARTSCRRR